MNSRTIRDKFFSFFKLKKHVLVESAPIVAKYDPTLMFTNSGMVQFKDYFLGNKLSKFPRVINSQNCLRVSGKHNDLEDVGKDTYHHTMFEMLGNWSFRDYFKEEAISFAWELLTKVYNLPENKIYVTVFSGDKEDNVQGDMESYEIWKKYLPESRILKFGKKDNFWEMGDIGPCGPCSEIHFDNREDKFLKFTPATDLINSGDPYVIELWNLVFVEYERKRDGKLYSLKDRYIDTGIGFERLVMIIQNKKSTYDTDLFKNLIEYICKKSKLSYGDNLNVDIAIRVVVDHIRAISLCLAEGQFPGPNNEAYVIRRLIRRSICYAYRYLDIKKPFLFDMYNVVLNDMGYIFPKLLENIDFNKEILYREENSFFKIIESGLKKINDIIIFYSHNKIIPGDKIFELYDTYGLPVDISRIIVEENGLQIDYVGFKNEMDKQTSRSKIINNIHDFSDWKYSTYKDLEYVGFIRDTTHLSGVKVIKYRKFIKNKELYFHIVLDKTPFYPESGGQQGDTGYFLYKDKKINVIDTKKYGDIIFHIIKGINNIDVFCFDAYVDSYRRNLISCNHTATHLLQFALRNILGNHIHQKGSFISYNYFRFDFSHFNRISKDELYHIEKQVNILIKNAINFHSFECSLSEAKKIGAIALFGEKYNENCVRIVKFGNSIELCGGTHVKNTNLIKYFKIIKEGSVSSGIRRIEAVTSDYCLDMMNNSFNKINDIYSIYNINRNLDLINYIENSIKDKQILKNKIDYYNNFILNIEIDNWNKSKCLLRDSNNMYSVVFESKLNDDNLIRRGIINASKILENIFLLIYNKDSVKNKYNVFLFFSKSLLDYFKCDLNNLIKSIFDNNKSYRLDVRTNIIFLNSDSYKYINNLYDKILNNLT